MVPNPLLLTPRLLARGLDDLHAIAEAARALPLSKGDPTAVVREALADLDAVADASRRLSEVESSLAERVDRVEVHLGQLLQALGAVEARLTSVEAQLGQLAGSARELAARAHGLEGAADRLTAMIDRIPGV
jgi:DNA repair ATPase RecN